MLLNLGREDQLDRGGLRRLVASINRYLGEPDAVASADAAQLVGGALGGRVPSGEDGRVVAHVGNRHRVAQGSRACRFTTNIERVLFGLVAKPVIDPMSKLSAVEWASCGVRSTVWTRSTRTRPIGRWICWSKPTPRPGTFTFPV